VTDKGDPPGKDYNGWGMLTPWRLGHYEPINSDFPREHGGWQVSRISQEHGILLWNGPKDDERKAPLKVGQRVRIWPNHSCIAGACFDYYFIVDSRNKGREGVVVDVWPRWRGW
jgi:D-serine deaminase-like pyridoxal phosphate-dependent protein